MRRTRATLTNRRARSGPIRRILRRLRDDVRVAGALTHAGVAVGSILLYPVRRRVGERRSQLDLRTGVRIVAPPDEPLLFLFREIWIDLSYAKGVGPLREGDVVVDIGAHVGLFTLWILSREPGARVVAVEPSSRTMRYLERNVGLNAARRVTVIQAACGRSSGFAPLFRRRSDMTASLYADRVAGGSVESVEVITLDEVFARGGVERCALLKLDCEGAEYEILLGAPVATLRCAERIVLEYHDGAGGHTPVELVSSLEGAGFDVSLQPGTDGVHGLLCATRQPIATVVGAAAVLSRDVDGRMWDEV